MNGKCEIHRNQTQPVFYGTQQCMKVWKDLVERYFNHYPETKSVTDGRTWRSLYTPDSLSGGIKTEMSFNRFLTYIYLRHWHFGLDLWYHCLVWHNTSWVLLFLLWNILSALMGWLTWALMSQHLWMAL